MAEILNNPNLLDRSNLLGEWLLDGDGIDTSGNSNDGTVSNVTFVSSDRGYTSEAGSFNGSSSKVSIGASIFTSTTSFSISMWLKSNLTGNSGMLITNGDNVNGFYSYLNIVGGGWGLRFGGTTIWETNPFTVGEWKHAIITFDATTCKSYIDGVELHNFNPTAVASNDNLTIGSFLGTSEWAKGDIGLVRIYDKALDENERKALHLEGLRRLGPTDRLPAYNTKITTNLTGSWPLDGNALDFSGNSNNGTWTTEAYAATWGGKSGSFNGTSSDVEATATTYSSAFSYSLWVNSDQSVSTTARYPFRHMLSVSVDGTGFSWGHASSSFQQAWFLRTTGGAFPVVKYTTALQTNTWYHLVCTYSGGANGTLRAYLDGNLETSLVISGTPNIGTLYTIGSTGSAAFFDGEIGLSSAYDSELSQGLIDNLYNEGARWILGNKYSLPNLEANKVLEISRAAVSGTYHDQSGNGNNSSSIVGVIDTTLGLNNQMDFDGTNDDIIIPDDATLDFGGGDFTVKFLLKPDNVTQNNKGLINKRDGSGGLNAGYSIRQFTTNIFVRTYDGTNNVDNTITTGLTANEWQLITITFTGGGNIEVFRNAVSQGTGSISTVGSMDNSTELFIGAEENAGSGSNFYNGKMAQVSIYNRKLSDQEIQQDFYSNFITN